MNTLNDQERLQFETQQFVKKSRSVDTISINRRNHIPFTLIHTKVWNASIAFIMVIIIMPFIDDSTRYTWVSLMKT